MNVKLIYVAILVLVTLASCSIFAPEENLERESDNTLHLDYEGQVLAEGGYTASFSLVNDSTGSIQYFGYTEVYPLYSAQARSDTGWTNLMWGWCGTGTTNFSLESGSSISFQTMLPNEACTWRLVLDITDMNMDTSRRAYSEDIIYTGSQNE